MNSLFRLSSRASSYLPKAALHGFDSRLSITAQTNVCCNYKLNTARSFHLTSQKAEKSEKPPRYVYLLEKYPSRDRRNKISVETSIKYLQSKAFKEGYGNDPVWFHYRRNHKGQVPPEKTRKMCIRNDCVVTASPCPICRDEYLVVDYTNVELLKHFISPHTGEIISYKKTGVCQQQYQNLLVAYLQAKDLGLITFDVPFREYNYSDYEISQC